MPLAWKIVIGSLIGLAIVGAIIGPAVYFGLKGKKNDQPNRVIRSHTFP